MEHHSILGALLVSAILGALVALVGTLFDPAPDNHRAKLAGLAVFVIAFLAYLGFLN